MVTDAGHFPRAAGHRVERPRGTATHLMIACMRGAGWVRVARATHPIRAGDIVWLPADEPHAYGSNDNDPWSISWVHFLSEESAAWQNQLGWAAKRPLALGHLPPDRMADLKIDEVYAWLDRGYAPLQLIGAATALRATFCAAINLANLVGETRSAAMRVTAVLEQIREKPSMALTLEELASSAGLSVPHFSDLFRRQAGHAPIDFLIRQRISRACHLLDTTDWSVTAIAAEVGYSDPYYFTRCFRRIMRESPRSYRQIVKG
jgi:AraC-like DNA-binding protein